MTAGIVTNVETVETDCIQVKDGRRWMSTRNLKEYTYIDRWTAEHESAKRCPIILDETRGRRADFLLDEATERYN